MKRYIITLIAAVALMATASAMSLNQAREQALFLTDKMAYELNLTNDQFNAAYEINLDYILNIERAGDLYGTFWTRRNNEMSYVLTAAQYNVFIRSEYFYRPVTWLRNEFRFIIYDRYPKNRFYRPAPPGYQTYRGGNRYYDNRPYRGRNFDSRSTKPAGNSHVTPTKPGTVTEHGHISSGRTGAGKNSTRPDGTMTKKEAVKQGKSNMSGHRH